MKKLSLLLTIVFITFISCKEEKSKTTEVKKEIKKEVKVTPKETLKKPANVIVWKAYKATGASHNGTINVKSTNFKLDGDNLIGGTVIIDMSSIKNLDVKDPQDNSDLINHLKNPDFFDVEQFPTSKFEFSNVSSNKEGKLEIKGKFTLNDITKEIKFDATIKDGMLESSVIKIDRTDFGIKYKSKKFFDNLKDRAINDVFDIAFKLKLK